MHPSEYGPFQRGADNEISRCYLALRKADLQVELHMYAIGGNIMKPPTPLVGDWSHRLEAWMRYQKLLETKSAS